MADIFQSTLLLIDISTHALSLEWLEREKRVLSSNPSSNARVRAKDIKMLREWKERVLKEHVDLRKRCQAAADDARTTLQDFEEDCKNDPEADTSGRYYRLMHATLTEELERITRGIRDMDEIENALAQIDVER